MQLSDLSIASSADPRFTQVQAIRMESAAEFKLRYFSSALVASIASVLRAIDVLTIVTAIACRLDANVSMPCRGGNGCLRNNSDNDVQLMQASSSPTSTTSRSRWHVTTGQCAPPTSSCMTAAASCSTGASSMHPAPATVKFRQVYA